MQTQTIEPKAKSSNVRPIPEGVHTITPHLVCAGAADAIAFYVKAFGAKELYRVPGPEGKILNARVQIGDSGFMLNDEFPPMAVGPHALKGTPVTIHLYVEDADAFAARAAEAGAKVLMPVQEMFWGDRYGMLEDPFGHRWSVATHVRDVSPQEMAEAAASCGTGCGE